MLLIVTNPDTDYIFVTDFDVLSEHLDNLINLLNQACLTVTTTTTSTLSMSRFLHMFFACVRIKLADTYF